MTKHFNFSKRLHWATLCCFLLPFFYTGCGSSAEEKAAKEKSKQDSIAAVTKVPGNIAQDRALTISNDTIVQSNTPLADTSTTQASTLKTYSTSSKTEKESKTPSQKISNTFTFLRPFLIPKENTYTGIATVIDSIPLIAFLAIFISFLLLIISLTVKFIDSNARKAIVLLDIFALIFLLVSQPYSWDSEKLWGFGVAITFASVLTIYDFYIIKLNKGLTD